MEYRCQSCGKKFFATDTLDITRRKCNTCRIKQGLPKINEYTAEPKPKINANVYSETAYQRKMNTFHEYKCVECGAKFLAKRVAKYCSFECSKAARDKRKGKK